MTNVEAFATAKRKSRYGHRDQVVWKDRAGEFHTAESAPSVIKTALLAVGASGRFTIISGRNIPYTYRWRDGLRMLRNARFGCGPA